jgi:hypothetical protein
MKSMKFGLAVLFAAIAPALVHDADAEGARATMVLPAVGCKTPEDYIEAVRLTGQRNDPGSGAMLRDYLERHGCVGFRTGEVVSVRKSATVEGERFVQLRRDPGGHQQNKGGPPIYWTVAQAIGQ